MTGPNRLVNFNAKSSTSAGRVAADGLLRFSETVKTLAETKDGKRWMFRTKTCPQFFEQKTHPRSMWEIKQKSWIHIFTSLQLKYWKKSSSKVHCKHQHIKSVNPHLYTLAARRWHLWTNWWSTTYVGGFEGDGYLSFKKQRVNVSRKRCFPKNNMSSYFFLVKHILMFSNYTKVSQQNTHFDKKKRCQTIS